MKKNTQHHLSTWILIICILTLSTSCEKENMEPELVPITTSGENTMGFYLNGEPVNTDGEYGGFDVSGIKGSVNNEGIAYILAAGDNPIFEIVIYFPKNSLNQSNEVTIDESLNNTKQIEYRDDSNLGGRAFTCDSLHHGKIKVSRMDDAVLAGTFEFEAIHEESGETIQVTDGRFDIKLD